MEPQGRVGMMRYRLALRVHALAYNLPYRIGKRNILHNLVRSLAGRILP
jgi:hypothetical protein